MTESVSQYQPPTNTDSNVPSNSSKSTTLLWVIAGVLVILIGIALWLIFGFTARVTFDNQQALGQFQVNSIPVNVYLWRTGYWRQVNRIKLVYTNEQIPITYELMNQGESVLKLNTQREGKSVTVQISYNAVKFSDVSANPNWLSNDLLAGICLALTDKPKMVAVDECYLQASEFNQWAQDNNIGRTVTSRSSRSWSLVGQAYAQSCSGTIPCGHDARDCTCPNTGESCMSGTSCGGIYTCQCGDWYCEENSINNLACSSLTEQSVCTTGGYNRCTNQCTVGNRPAEIFCTWSDANNLPPPAPGL